MYDADKVIKDDFSGLKIEVPCRHGKGKQLQDGEMHGALWSLISLVWNNLCDLFTSASGDNMFDFDPMYWVS